MLDSLDWFVWDNFTGLSPIFNGKIYGFRFRFSLKPIHGREHEDNPELGKKNEREHEDNLENLRTIFRVFRESEDLCHRNP